jgi:hypothetical protein
MPCDPVLIDQRNEIPLRIATEGGFAEVFVLTNEILWAGVEVREIAPSAARDPDLFTGRFRMIDNENAGPCVGRAHHACSTCADDQSFYLHSGPYGASAAGDQIQKI